MSTNKNTPLFYKLFLALFRILFGYLTLTMSVPIVSVNVCLSVYLASRESEERDESILLSLLIPPPCLLTRLPNKRVGKSCTEVTMEFSQSSMDDSCNTHSYLYSVKRRKEFCSLWENRLFFFSDLRRKKTLEERSHSISLEERERQTDIKEERKNNAISQKGVRALTFLVSLFSFSAENTFSLSIPHYPAISLTLLVYHQLSAPFLWKRERESFSLHSHPFRLSLPLVFPLFLFIWYWKWYWSEREEKVRLHVSWLWDESVLVFVLFPLLQWSCSDKRVSIHF